MRSLRTRLLALWLMLAVSAAAIGFVLFEFYRQSANSEVMRAEDAVARSCRDIGERYAFVMVGWNGSTNSIDDTLRQRLVDAVQLAFARAPGVEGGIWQADAGSLAYAFPTYEGTGPKTDLPEAERASIRQVNGDVARSERPLTVPQTSRSQVLLLHACPIAGALPGVTGWTMTRVFTGQGPAYNQLLIGFRHGRDHAARRARRCNEGKARAHVPRPRRRGRIELRGSLISKLKLMGGGAPKFGGKGFNLAALFGGKGLGGKSFGRKMGY